MAGFATRQHASAVGTHPPPPSPPHPSDMSQSTRCECPASRIELALVIYFTFGNIHVSVPFSQNIPPSPSPTESKSLPCASAPPLLSRIWADAVLRALERCCPIAMGATLNLSVLLAEAAHHLCFLLPVLKEVGSLSHQRERTLPSEETRTDQAAVIPGAVGQTEEKQTPYDIAYMCNREKWYRRTHL